MYVYSIYGILFIERGLVMKTPDSQIKATMKYAKEKLKRIPLDVKKDYYDEVIVAEAERRGMSVRAFILSAIEEKIERGS